MKILVIVIAVLMSNISLAQHESSISGRVLSGDSDSALPYVSVLLFGEDTLAIAGTITDESGRFSILGLSAGKYRIDLSYIGFTTMHVPILIGTKNPNHDLGKIYLEANPELVDEVVVTAARATVSAGLDKKSYDMQNQIAQSGGSVLDAVKGLPGVTVDQEGNLLLRGSNQVAVLVDGKQSGMTGFGSQRGLGNIPAANIERIEIINNPSSKYDASGMAGIVNIIYKKEKEQGINGEIGLAFGMGVLSMPKEDLPTKLGSFHLNPKVIPNFSLNYRGEKSSTYFQGESLHQKSLPNNEFTTRDYADGASTISQVPENRTQNHYVLKAGQDWQINARNSLGIAALFDYEHHIDTAQVPYIDQITNSRYRYWHWKEDEITGFLNFLAHYELDFEEPGHQLKISAQYARGWEDESYFLNDSSSFRVSSDATHILATENTTSVSADYQRPFRYGKWEVGTKLQFRTIPVTYEVDRGQETIIYEGIGTWSDWGENLYAVYLNYLLEKEYFDIESGFRLEQTNVFYNIDPANIYYPENDKYDYLKLYPNVRFTFKPNLQNNISIFYNNRVDRPGEPNLRIFPKYDDPELLKIGDPYVRPQFTQTFELAYKRIWETGSIFLSTYRRLIDSPFLRIYSIDDSNPNYSIINKTYQNVGSGTNTGIEFILAQKITPSWKLSTSINWYNNKIDAFTGHIFFPYERPFNIEETIDVTWDMKLNNQIDLPGDLQLQVTGIYLAPKNTPQGRTLSRSSLDLGLKKIIMDGRAELLFSFSDIFNKFGIREEINTPAFNAFYENYYETQIARIGFKYKW